MRIGVFLQIEVSENLSYLGKYSSIQQSLWLVKLTLCVRATQLCLKTYMWFLASTVTCTYAKVRANLK